MTSPADLGWGDPRTLTNADMTGARLWPGHVVRVRSDDVAVVMVALVRRLRGAGWAGPDPLLDESGYARRLKRWAEAKYRDQGLTEAQWLLTAPLSEWSDHAWGTAVDLDTTVNPMLATRPVDPQAHTTMPVAACPGIAAEFGLEWGGSWTDPWDPQHWQVAVSPARLAQIAALVRRSMEVLDYSSGYPAPVAIKAAGYAGVVRYIGTPGRGKNLTRAEAQAMRAAGIPIALVYETSAGWALGGTQAGADAARASLADAAVCEVQVRCVYMAVDVDVTGAVQMQAVQQMLDGAAGVLGRNRVGVYGEADVIDACVPGHAAYGWQTRAWSGGRLSGKAAILQQIGYVDVGGVQCDRSTVLKDDWGQWPYQGDVPTAPTYGGTSMLAMTCPGRAGHVLVPGYAPGIANGLVVSGLRKCALGQDVTTAEYDAIMAIIGNTDIVQGWATARHDDGAWTLRELLDRTPGELAALAAAQAATDAKLDALAAAVANIQVTGGTVDPQAIAKAVLDEQHRRDAE